MLRGLAVRVGRLSPALGLTLIVAAPALAKASATVSPGELDHVPIVASACPAFSWTVTPEAVLYELAVHPLDASGAPLEAGLLRVAISGGAASWSPSIEQCLAPGRSYAWTVRALDVSGNGDWAAPRFFSVATGHSTAEVVAAFAIVADYLASGGTVDELVDPTASGLPPPAAAVTTDPSPQALAPSPTVLAAPDSTAFLTQATPTTGVVFGAHGVSPSSGDGSAGVVGQATGASGNVAGLYGQTASADGAAGVFDNTAAGDVLRGLANGAEVFVVEGDGDVIAASFSGDGSNLTAVVAATADALASNPSNCLAGSVPRGITQNGDAENCFDVATQVELDVKIHTAADITSGEFADARIPADIARDSELTWNNLTGIPAGFADGTDDTGGTELQQQVDETEAATCMLYVLTLNGQVPDTCPHKKVFVTGTSHGGDIGGLAGADQTCQDRADLEGLSGTFKAWLSDGTTAAADRLTHASVFYMTVDGAAIALDWDDLVDGTLLHPFDRSVSGNPVNSSTRVWTNTDSGGGIADFDEHCVNWTADNAILSGGYGRVDQTSAGWTDQGAFLCDDDLSLYCIEQ